MQTPPRPARFLATLLIAGGSFPAAPPPATGGEILGKVWRGMARVVDGHHARAPATAADCCVEQLAGEIDWLERYIDRYGSIVAKHPDVWGQSRLTRHRAEYEEKLKAEMGNFKELNNASLRRSDQSFLGMALAIQGLAGKGEVPKESSTTSVMNLISTGTSPGEAVPLNRTAPFAKTTGGTFAEFGLDGQNAIGLEPTIHLDHLDGYVKHLQELRRINEGDDNSDSPGYALNLVRIPVSILPGQYTQAGHGAEITVTADLQLGDDLLPTTFRNLVINDVIDTIAPSLTFATNDPEARHAAWEAVSTDRDSTTRELSKQLAFLKTKHAAECRALDELQRQLALSRREEAIATENADTLKRGFEQFIPQDGPHVDALLKAIASPEKDEAARTPGPLPRTTSSDTRRRLVERITESLLQSGATESDTPRHEEHLQEFLGRIPGAATAFDDYREALSGLQAKAQTVRRTQDTLARAQHDLSGLTETLRSTERRIARLRSSITKLRGRLASAAPVAVPSTKSRRSRLPIPPSQFSEVGGDKQVAFLILKAYEGLNSHPANSPCIDYNDVRGLLGEELQAAYDLLAQPSHAAIWSELPSWNIPDLVRTRRSDVLEQRRALFFARLEEARAAACAAGPVDVAASPCAPGDPCSNEPDPQRPCETVTGVLAWMIVVESALLDDRLVEDMRSAASLQGRLSPPGGAWSGPYFGPNPSPEARRSFNDYVRLRWPIRVFALDPATQEQNVEDMYSKQREMQIALAVAAGGGRLNSQAALRYARRLETDMATIALNKTAVAFSHGSDTFGWRFYPRFQSPPTRGNLATFAETLIGTNSEKHDVADRRLEPGIRECTAIIVMPSFVPFVSFDVRTNWFSLNHPQNTDQNMRQTLELSRSVKAMQNSAARCSQCAGMYRDGEVARLMRRVEQLDRELPLQSMLTQIPYENTSGGFELFNTGITDLAPELVGWYGAPGIDPSGPTTLFLIGKGFSVLDTKIIAGGLLAEDVELMSRQVVKVVIPRGARPIIKPTAANCRCRQQAPFPCPAPEARRESEAGHLPAPAVGAAGRSRRTVTASRVVQVAGTVDFPSLPGNPVRGSTAPASRLVDRPRLAARSMPDAAPESVIPQPLPHPGATGAPCAEDAFPSAGGPAAGSAEEPDPGCGEDCGAMEYVDVHLATPYGVSGHLLVPCVRTGCADSSDTSTKDGLALADDVLITLTSEWKDDAWRLRDDFLQSPSEIRIAAPPGFIPPADARLHVLVHDDETGRFTAISTAAPPFDTRQGVYRITGADLRNFIGDGAQPSGDGSLRGALKPIVQETGGVPTTYTVTLTLGTDRQQEPIRGRFHVTIRPTGK